MDPDGRESACFSAGVGCGLTPITPEIREKQAVAMGALISAVPAGRVVRFIASAVRSAISSGDKSTNKNVETKKHSIDEKKADHMFGERKGHVSDTTENRQMLQDVADDPSTTLGSDEHGNIWSGKTREDGTQVWTTTRGDKITGGGVNQTPKEFNPKTGLSAPQKPVQ